MHLRHEVGACDELGRGVAAGQHEVERGRPRVEERQDIVHIEQAELHGVIDLVEDDEVPCAARDGRARFRKRLLRCLLVLGFVNVSLAREAFACLMHFDRAARIAFRQRLDGFELTVLPSAFDELQDQHGEPFAPRAHREPERRRRLALAVACVHDDDAARLRSFPLPSVFSFVVQKILLQCLVFKNILKSFVFQKSFLRLFVFMVY